MKLHAARVIVNRSSIHQWGLFTEAPFLKDEMITEYVGELIRSGVAQRVLPGYPTLRALPCSFPGLSSHMPSALGSAAFAKWDFSRTAFAKWDFGSAPAARAREGCSRRRESRAVYSFGCCAALRCAAQGAADGPAREQVRAKPRPAPATDVIEAQRIMLGLARSAHRCGTGTRAWGLGATCSRSTTSL